MGGYGFLRLGLPILPDAAATFAPLISWFSVAAILYGGYLALAQTDLKKLIAYSSISHMGFVTLGIFSFSGQGIQGAVLQMFNHGITTGALFLAVGLLYDRTHSRTIGDYGGLHAPMPRFAAFLCLFSVASFGLPGTSNFIGEFLVLVGTSYESFAKVLLAMGGIVLAAAYMLWMLQRVILGQAPSRAMGLLPDLSAREIARAGAAGHPDLRHRSLPEPANEDHGRERHRAHRADPARDAAGRHHRLVDVRRLGLRPQRQRQGPRAHLRCPRR